MKTIAPVTLILLPLRASPAEQSIFRLLTREDHVPVGNIQRTYTRMVGCVTVESGMADIST